MVFWVFFTLRAPPTCFEKLYAPGVGIRPLSSAPPTVSSARDTPPLQSAVHLSSPCHAPCAWSTVHRAPWPGSTLLWCGGHETITTHQWHCATPCGGTFPAGQLRACVYVCLYVDVQYGIRDVQCSGVIDTQNGVSPALGKLMRCIMSARHEVASFSRAVAQAGG